MRRVAGNACHSLPISQHIRRIYEKQMESYVFPGDATHGQPYIHVQDLAACVRGAIAKRKELDAEEVFLVGEPRLQGLPLPDKFPETEATRT